MSEPRVELQRFHHVTVAVADLPRAVADWSTGLGWAPSLADASHAVFALDGSYVELVPAGADGRTGVVAVAVVVDDVPAAVARIRAGGGRVETGADGSAALDRASANGVPLVLVLDDGDVPVTGGSPYRRVNHVVVAVADLDAALARWTAMLGEWPPFPWEGEEANHVPVGQAWLGLTSAGTAVGAIQSFLASRGEGVFALALVVDDQPATVAALAERGVRLVGGVGQPQTFLHPSATHGLLVELVDGRPPSR